MSNQRNVIKKKTNPLAIAIILIAVIIGAGAITASLFIVNSEKAGSKSKKEEDYDRKEDDGRDSAAPGQIEIADEPVNGADADEPDEEIQEETIDAAETEENADDENNSEDTVEEEATAEETVEEAPAQEEAEESETEETEDGDSGEQGGSGLLGLDVIRIKPLLDSCYMYNGSFDVDALKEGGFNENREYDEGEYYATFRQLVYAGQKGDGITDDCLAKFAEENKILYVKSAVNYFGLDFSNAIIKENNDKVLFVMTDMGPAEVTLSDGGQDLCIMLTQGLNTDDASGESVMLSVEVKTTSTSKGSNTFINVSLWYY